MFINHTTITAVLPRRQRDTEITILTPSKINSSIVTSSIRTAFTIGAVASSIPPSTTASSSSSSSSGNIGSLKRIYTLNKNTGQLCIFEDPLRDISRHVLVDTSKNASDVKDGGVGKGVGIDMLCERYEAQVPDQLLQSLRIH
jgi:hypothetical protein